MDPNDRAKELARLVAYYWDLAELRRLNAGRTLPAGSGR